MQIAPAVEREAESQAHSNSMIQSKTLLLRELLHQNSLGDVRVMERHKLHTPDLLMVIFSVDVKCS